MNPVRCAGVAIGFALLALSLVYLRSAQHESASRAIRLETEWFQLKDERAHLQAKLARLQAPQRVRDFVDWFQTDLVPPGETQAKRSTYVAMNQSRR